METLRAYANKSRLALGYRLCHFSANFCDWHLWIKKIIMKRGIVGLEPEGVSVATASPLESF